MPNTYFQFKQFIVHQERAAMKVSTDSCLFGAWVADRMKERSLKQVLDIGTGTGLLLLMLAQQLEADFEGVELEEGGFQDAELNVSLSPWKERIRILMGDAREMIVSGSYDLIISNPPFFTDSLKSSDPGRNLARHTQALTLKELVNLVSTSLSENGVFAVQLPAERGEEMKGLCSEKGLFCKEQADVMNVPGEKVFRSFFLFGRKEEAIQKELIPIRASTNAYSETFSRYLSTYYLYL